MSAYRKLVAFIVGAIVMMLANHTGIDLSSVESALVDTVLLLLTGFGVWGVPNTPVPDPDPTSPPDST